MNAPAQPESPATGQPQYEFDGQQNCIIGDLSAAMRWVAAPLMVIGVLYAIAAVAGVVQAFSRPEIVGSVILLFVGTVFYFVLGVWTRRASDSFRRVTATSGQDVSNLMDALDNLRKMYSLLSAIVKVYLVIVILSLVFSMVMLIATMIGGPKS